MRIFEKLRSVPKRVSAGVAIAVAVVTIPAVLFAWGPTRPTYTMEKPADHVTFNSITNNPNIGDERNFVGIREAGSSTTWTDNMKVQAGKEYTVRVYVHNNAATNLNASGKGIAKDVTASVNLPTTTGKSIQVDGTISASNASPKEVWDDAVFSSDQNFNLAYVKGSLKYENNSVGKNGGVALSESIFTSAGTKLGYDKLDGTIPGCLQYAGYISFTVKPQFAQSASFTMSKMVSKHGANNWVESYAAQPGETVDYLVQYKNTGDVQQDNVTVKDKQPAAMTYVAGSTVLGNSLHPSGIKTNDGITTSGLNIGSYAKNGNAWLIYSSKVAAKDKLACGKQTLTNTASVETDYGTKTDTANVTTEGNDCKPTPVYKCNSLSVQKLSDTSFKFSTDYTVQNATLKGITYVVRDSKGNEVYRGPNATYTTTKAGDFTVQAYLTVTVDGKDQTVTSDACKKSFSICEKKIKVCELATKKIVEINESDFDAKKYSKNLDDCKVKPVYTCDSLSVAKLSDTSFKFTTAYTVKDATFKNVTYVVRDASGNELYRGPSATYTQTKAGTYTVQTYVTVTVDGKDQTVTSDNCKKSFTVEEKKITVCELATKKVVTINESDFDSSKYSKNLDDCKEKDITVCELATKKIVTIKESEFDATKYSKDLNDCKEVKITVCELDTKKIVTINESDFDASKYSKNLDDCKEVVPNKITVCELATKQIVTIDEDKFDDTKYSKNLDDCKVVKIQVCELDTKKIVEIDESAFDEKKYSKDLNDCKEEVVTITVCEIASKQTVTINESDFDSSKYTKDMSVCAPEETPTELPHTGVTEVFTKLVGVVSLAGATAYYVASRRNN